MPPKLRRQAPGASALGISSRMQTALEYGEQSAWQRPTQKPRTTRNSSARFFIMPPPPFKFKPTYDLGDAHSAQARQWSRPLPPGGRPHIACLPQELHDKIQELADPISLAILSVTCKALRIRLPHTLHTKKGHGVLEMEVCVGHGKSKKLWELLEQFMKNGIMGQRLYCGHYEIHKFVGDAAYRAARDVYWRKYPQLPYNYVELVEQFNKDEEEAKLKAITRQPQKVPELPELSPYQGDPANGMIGTFSQVSGPLPSRMNYGSVPSNAYTPTGQHPTHAYSYTPTPGFQGYGTLQLGPITNSPQTSSTLPALSTTTTTSQASSYVTLPSTYVSQAATHASLSARTPAPGLRGQGYIGHAAYPSQASTYTSVSEYAP